VPAYFALHVLWCLPIAWKLNQWRLLCEPIALGVIGIALAARLTFTFLNTTFVRFGNVSVMHTGVSAMTSMHHDVH
jgi:hypothetical protein